MFSNTIEPKGLQSMQKESSVLIAPTQTVDNLTGIYGHRTAARRFRVTHADRTIDPDALHSLLTGDAVAHVVHQYLEAEEASRLASGFDRQVVRARSDDVPALTIGASHYGKTLTGYFAEVRRTRSEMGHVYDAAGFDLDQLTEEDIGQCLDDGQSVRNAQHRNHIAMPIRAAAWSGSGMDDLALAAHEDEQQLRDPRQRGFEIQQVVSPVALNLYARVPESGGVLRVWAMQPSRLCQVHLGVTGRGYPYPVSQLADVDHLDIKPDPGDLVLLNGRYLHAVTGWAGKTSDRIVFNGFMGLSEDGCTLMRWS